MLPSAFRRTEPTSARRGYFFYFYGPQMVVGQVPMEIIHFEHGHDVELFFYKFHVVEVATYVEHHTSVSIGGFIFDFHTRDFPCYVIDNRFALDLGRKQLHNRLHAIKDSLRSFGFDNYLFGGYCQLVAFVPYFSDLSICRLIAFELPLFFIFRLYPVEYRIFDWK